MNYKEFMAVCNSCGTVVKSDISNKDAKDKSGIDQDLNKDVASGKGTPNLEKFTKAYLNTVKNKTVVKK